MPAYSTIDMVYEVYLGIIAMNSSQFTLDQLVQRMDRHRKEKGEKRKVSKESVDRILNRLWLLLSLRKSPAGTWEKGSGPIRGMTNIRPDIVRRVINDQNIDASPPEIDHWIKLGEEPTTHKAYICYPYHDNPLRRSFELLILLIHLYPKARDRFVPATPHEMYWRLEETATRETAMNTCERLIEKCDLMLYCLRKDEAPSTGMKKDMNIANKRGQKIEYIEDILGYYPDLEKIMKDSGLSEYTPISEELRTTPTVQ